MLNSGYAFYSVSLESGQREAACQGNTVAYARVFERRLFFIQCEGHRLGKVLTWYLEADKKILITLSSR